MSELKIPSEIFGDIKVDKTWNYNNFITIVKDKLESVENEMKVTFTQQEIENNFTPKKNVLRFLQIDLSKIRVIILGQDPYPERGVATGRAFEVKGLKSWCEKEGDKMNYSLKNILKAIYIAEVKNASKETTIEDVRKEIENGTFNILSPKKWFKKMENQGVLFLNTSFTCKVGVSNYHRIYWEDFTKTIIQYLINYLIENKDNKNKNKEFYWFLWGDSAQSIFLEVVEKLKKDNPSRSTDINDKNKSIKCCHPRNPSFINEKNGFEATKGLINWLGTHPVRDESSVVTNNTGKQLACL